MRFAKHCAWGKEGEGGGGGPLLGSCALTPFFVVAVLRRRRRRRGGGESPGSVGVVVFMSQNGRRSSPEKITIINTTRPAVPLMMSPSQSWGALVTLPPALALFIYAQISKSLFYGTTRGHQQTETEERFFVWKREGCAQMGRREAGRG